MYVCWCRSAHAFLLQHTENLTDQGFTLAFESSSIGSSHIYAHARARGIKIAFSGAGGDEIYTDYQRISWWPKDLQNIFPWPAFFLEEMHDFLRKEELVAGAHGMEGRYPPLDVDLVQEWLWLHPKMHSWLEKCHTASVRSMQLGSIEVRWATP